MPAIPAPANHSLSFDICVANYSMASGPILERINYFESLGHRFDEPEDQEWARIHAGWAEFTSYHEALRENFPLRTTNERQLLDGQHRANAMRLVALEVNIGDTVIREGESVIRGDMIYTFRNGQLLSQSIYSRLPANSNWAHQMSPVEAEPGLFMNSWDDSDPVRIRLFDPPYPRPEWMTAEDILMLEIPDI